MFLCSLFLVPTLKSGERKQAYPCVQLSGNWTERTVPLRWDDISPTVFVQKLDKDLELAMTITVFAEKYRLNLKRDPQDDTDIIRGNDGRSHIFEYGENQLGVLIMPETGTSNRWTAARKAFEAAGMKITQNADCEGAATFDPTNPEQVRVAMKYADIRPRRKPSPEQLAALKKGRALARSKISVETPVAEAVLTARSDDQAVGRALG